MIEHLTLEQGRQLLRLAHVALAPGGVIRLSTPDVGASARSYLENGDLARAGMAPELRTARSDVERSVAGDGNHPDLKRLGHRMHPAEVATPLCVEGTKPG